MKVPLSWLSEYIKIPSNDKDLSDRLTMIGHMLDKREIKNKEVIFDLELRGNRADLFGILGIAREVQAAYQVPIKLPKIVAKPKRLPQLKEIDIQIEATDLVNRFYSVVMPVKVGPSPKWLAERLELYGIEPINNVVDITNYIMIETAQPLHAFDLDKIEGKTLILKRARSEEVLVTLDGTPLSLTKEELTISDKQGVIALAGIIGGRRTAINNQTKYILLEGGNYNRVNIRRSTQRLSLRTDASTRLEKDLDPNLIEYGVHRAIDIIAETANSKKPASYFDYYPKISKPQEITFPLKDIKRLGGVELDQKAIKKILDSLEFKNKADNKDTLKVLVPTFRTDITESADLVEEVLRIWGFDKIPSIVQNQTPPQQLSKDLELEENSRRYLTSLGINEAINLPIVSRDNLRLFNISTEDYLSITNPPVPQQDIMQPTLAINLFDYLVKNYANNQEYLQYFEIGKTFSKTRNKVVEVKTLGIIFAGVQTPSYWNNNQPELVNFEYSKGILEVYLRKIGILAKFTFKKVPYFSSNQSMQIIINGKEVGKFGSISKSIRHKKKINLPTYFAELNIDALSILAAPTQFFSVIPNFPPVIQDISLELPSSTSAEDIQQTITTFDKSIIGVKLTSVYNSTITFRVKFLDPMQTLQTSQVNKIKDKLANKLDKLYGAKIK